MAKTLQFGSGREFSFQPELWDSPTANFPPGGRTDAQRWPGIIKGLRFLGFIICGCLGLTGSLSGQEASLAAAKQQVAQVLADQAKAWNSGDVEHFMDGYAKTPGLRFASGGTVTHGWQETLDRYKQRYPDRAAMGTLTFSDLDTTILSSDAALVFGRWHLVTATGEPNGLFTLLFRRSDAGWRIVADHTSAAP